MAVLSADMLKGAVVMASIYLGMNLFNFTSCTNSDGPVVDDEKCPTGQYAENH
jgi:hypothetical protein